MGFVGLFLSGSVLFLNSLMLLGKAEAKSVGIFNLFIGSVQMIIPFYLIVSSNQTNWDLYQNAPIFLFGLTYLFVGMTLLINLEGNSLGWFCLWVTVIAIVYTITSFLQFGDLVNTLTWGMWAYLWFLFFLSNTLKWKIDQYIGIVAFIQSWTTLTIPALLFFLGVWNTKVVTEVWSIVLIISIVCFAVILFIGKFSIKKEVVPNHSQILSVD